MTEYYVILSAEGGYWDGYSFTGWLKAWRYEDEFTANHFAREQASKVEPCTVIKIYNNTI